MPKAQHRDKGEQKTERLNARVSPTAKDSLISLAEGMGISLGELLERLGRGELRVTPSLGE